MLRRWVNLSTAIVLTAIYLGLHQSGAGASPRTHLSSASNRLIRFLCTVDSAIVKLPKAWNLPKKCAPPTAKVEPCSNGSRTDCKKFKGNQTSGPVLTSPYGRTLVNRSPLLAWSPVSGATSYSVAVTGKGVHWQRTVGGTTLTYPGDQPVMQWGHAYQITIIANQNDTPVTADQFAINLLPQSDVKEIEAILKQIKDLPISLDQRTYLTDNLFANDGLLTESIVTLEACVNAGSQSPLIYRTLGDRYLQAGDSDTARQRYETGNRFARMFRDIVEQAKTQARLELIASYSQPPTNTNPAQ